MPLPCNGSATATAFSSTGPSGSGMTRITPMAVPSAASRARVQRALLVVPLHLLFRVVGQADQRQVRVAVPAQPGRTAQRRRGPLSVPDLGAPVSARVRTSRRSSRRR